MAAGVDDFGALSAAGVDGAAVAAGLAALSVEDFGSVELGVLDSGALDLPE